MATMVQDEQVKAQPVKKKRLSVRGFINSPYVFILAPLLLGGFYLLTHPQYIVLAMQYPYALGFLVGLIPTVFIIKLIINFFSVIEQWIRLQFEKARGSKKGFFFEMVIVVFMFVSICEAGPFFNDIQHNILNGVLGYITVLAFDLIAVVCIDARRKELAKGGSRSGIYLLGVIICALVSMTANLYSALQNFHAPTDASIPSLLKSVAPYIGIMFPVMIVFLAFSRDTEIEIDDAEAYRKQQQKRVDFLAVRREILAAITAEMEQIDLLKKREFVLKSWFFTKKKMNLVIEIVTTKMQSILQAEVGALKKEIAEKERVIVSQLETVKTLASQVQDQQEIIAYQIEQLAGYQAAIPSLDYAKIAQEVMMFLPQSQALNYQEIALEIIPLLPVQRAAISEQKKAFQLGETPGEIQAVSTPKTKRITRELPPLPEEEKESEEVTGYIPEEVMDDDRVKMLFKRSDSREKAVKEAINSKALPLRKGRISETGLKTWVQSVKRSRETTPKAKEKADA